ncbi:MAG: Holliday junction resolvase RecU [Cetobacterium sp.]
MAVKNNGHIFEEEFKKSLDKYIKSKLYYKKLKTGGLGYKGVDNECDFLIYKYPNIILLELKSHKGRSLPLDCIRPNQFNGLLDRVEQEGVLGGILVNFRDYGKTYFIPIYTLYEFVKEGTRKSINIDFCEEKGIKIPQIKARTRFTYDIDYLFKKLGVI